MSPIWLQLRFRFRLARLRRFAKGDNRDYAPMFSILLLLRSRFRLERLRRFVKGDNRDYAPVCPI